MNLEHAPRAKPLVCIGLNGEVTAYCMGESNPEFKNNNNSTITLLTRKETTRQGLVAMMRRND